MKSAVHGLKRLSQSLLYLPHFISWVVVAGIAVNLFSLNGGTVNNVLNVMGIKSIPFFKRQILVDIYLRYLQCLKEIGWGTIIYLAALTGVDESLYEAAYLDGATRMQRIIYVTLPMKVSFL